MMTHFFYDGRRHHRDAHRAAVKRAVVYGTGGFLNPTTYTVEPWALTRVTGMSFGSAILWNLRLAGVGSAIAATAGYLGLDPFDVTPGYGYSRRERHDRFGREIDAFDVDLRLYA